LDPGVDAGGVDLELGPGLLGRVPDVDGSVEGREAAADLRHHEVAGHGADHRMVRIELPRALRRHPGAGGWLGHGGSFAYGSSLRTTTTRPYSRLVRAKR